MTLADVAAIKVKATKHHNEIKRMNALKSKAKSKKESGKVRRTWDSSLHQAVHTPMHNEEKVGAGGMNWAVRKIQEILRTSFMYGPF